MVALNESTDLNGTTLTPQLLLNGILNLLKYRNSRDKNSMLLIKFFNIFNIELIFNIAELRINDRIALVTLTGANNSITIDDIRIGRFIEYNFIKDVMHLQSMDRQDISKHGLRDLAVQNKTRYILRMSDEPKTGARYSDVVSTFYAQDSLFLEKELSRFNDFAYVTWEDITFIVHSGDEVIVLLKNNLVDPESKIKPREGIISFIHNNQPKDLEHNIDCFNFQEMRIQFTNSLLPDFIDITQQDSANWFIFSRNVT